MTNYLMTAFLNPKEGLGFRITSLSLVHTSLRNVQSKSYT